ncbi:MAG: cysteine hydrolase [Chloroflexi bacterium]|nr:cysteine hydrolase [Chloroflexota bacterium]
MLSLEELVDPRHTALVVVDVQNDFCHSEGDLGRRAGDVSRIQAAVRDLVGLIIQARDKGVAIIFIRAVHGAWTDSETWLRRRKDVPVAQLRTCQDNTWGGDFYEVQPLPGDKVIAKPRYSAFYGTELDVMLRARGIRTLLMTGVTTNVCVESTARDGMQRDYDIVLVENCCGTTRDEDHQATLRNIRNQFGVVATSGEVVEAWTKRDT